MTKEKTEKQELSDAQRENRIITVALIMYETKKRNQKSNAARQLQLDQEAEEAA